jgi:hypothetical protein
MWFYVLFPSITFADLPLTVEDLITDKGKIKLDVSFSYSNSDRKGIFTGEPVDIQTGPTSFVTVPTLVGESQGNNDTLVGTLGLRYGFTAKAEFFARGTYLYSENRTSDVSGMNSDSDSRFADAWAGVNYQFKKDDDTPAVLGFAEVALREKHRESSRSLQSYLAGLTTYKALDPVVFALSTAYRLNQNRKDGELDYKPGNMLLFSPSVAFAVNDRVTFTTGLQWTSRHADKSDGKEQGFRRTSTDMLLGVGYGISKGSTINVTFKANASGSNGADLRLNWLHTCDAASCKLPRFLC